MYEKSNFYKNSLQKMDVFERKKLEDVGANITDQDKFNKYVENRAKQNMQGNIITFIVIALVIFIFFFR